jgi:hypothetical protein
MRKSMIKAKNPNAWNGKSAIDPKFVLEVNKETNGLTLPSV